MSTPISTLEILSPVAPTETPTFSAEHIAAFLQQQPDFFLQHEELLTYIHLPQSSGGTLSLGARQAHIMRDKLRNSEKVLHELHIQAHANEQRAHKLHRLALLLLRRQAPEAMLRDFCTALAQEFDLAACLAHVPSDQAKLSSFHQPESAWHSLMLYGTPAIPRMNNEIREILRKRGLPETGSVAAIPFGIGQGDENNGVLLLVKREPQGFSPDMGSLFLLQVGELLSTALAHTPADETHP